QLAVQPWRDDEQRDPAVARARLVPGDEQRPALLPGRRADDLGNRLREPAIGRRDTAVVTIVAHAGGDPRELWRVGAQVAGEVGHGHDVRRAGTPVIGE